MLPLLTPRAVAGLLRVSESTVRRWCDSGLLEVAKTTGGHRRIERQVLLAFARDHRLAVVDASAMATAGRGGRLAGGAELADRLYGLVTAGDEVAAREFAYELVNRTGEVAPLCDDVIVPVMYRIGVEWADGTLRVFREHAATQAIIAALAGARAALAPAPSDAPIAVCAGLPGDPYVLGPGMCSLILHSAGYRTMLLGSDTPVEDIVDAAVELCATVIAISVSAPTTANDLIALCGAAATRRIPLAVGGRQLTPELRRQIEPDFFGDTMAHLASYARRLRASAPHPSPAAST